MNDFRPIALTSVPMKCFEKIIKFHLLAECAEQLDPLQFAYKPRRGVDDAILLFSNNLYKHLDVPKGYVRTLFVDFSSAFNTIQPHILVNKLLEMNVSPNIALWIMRFLTHRPQYVSIKDKNVTYQSTQIVTNTGAPQGTVLAPVLFSIYTNDCQSNITNVPIIKYADDTAIQALIKNEKDLHVFNQVISNFVVWCEDNYLQLNVKKTKEMIFDFRKKGDVHKSLDIKTERVERVNEYKYLGVVFDENLDWSCHSKKVVGGLKVKVHLMRKLFCLKVDNRLLSMFFKSCMVSVLCFCLAGWGGNTRKYWEDKINRLLKHANKMMNNTVFSNFQDYFVSCCNDKINKILRDESHPLHSEIQISKRSGRLIHCKTKTERHRRSFIPFAIQNYKFKL